MQTKSYKGHTIERHPSGWYSVFATEYGYLKADTLEGARRWVDAICEHCGLMHDVDDEHAATGADHDYVQASRIHECNKQQFPDDEALQD
jgi:hypothetical protein